MAANLAYIRRRLNFFDKPVRVTLRSQEVADLDKQAKALARALSVSNVTAKVLVCRGVVDEKSANEFLAPSLREHLPDPHTMKNIEAASELILKAVVDKKQITIFTDFDVDGLSSGSQLLLYLNLLGARVNTYTPDRFTEGYGLSAHAIEKLVRARTELLITVDCGISSHREIARAKRLGLQVVVIDHHQPHGLPPADVVVNPAQEGCPFQDHALAAAGIVWMLLIVLRGQARAMNLGDLAADPKLFLDLAALGTICDMVPLQGPNRVIAHRGLDALKSSQRVGIIALKEVCGLDGSRELNAGHVGYLLGPRINAAGRIGDASSVIELFTTTNSLRAKAIAKSIDKANQQRQTVEQRVLGDCIDLVLEDDNYVAAPALALYGKEFHLGVIGIVAQRLVEQFNRPAAVMAPGETVIGKEIRPVIKGSVRSISGFHVAEVLDSLSGLLLSQGGHRAAGGFSVSYENLEVFQKAFIAKAGELLTAEMLERERRADVEVTLGELDFDLVKELLRLAPFGIGNPAPVLVARGIKVETVSSLSSGHVRFRVSDGGAHFNALGWNFQGHPLIQKGARINLAFAPEINTYHGVSSVQLIAKDVWAD